MNRLRFGHVLATILALASAASAGAAHTHWAIQAVDADGAGNHPDVGSTNKVVLEGVVLNNPEDMLDGAAGAHPFMGGQWQVFVQGEGADHAGTALWMGQNYGKVSGNHPEDSYTESEWQAEMLRLNYINRVGETGAGHALVMGDRVRVTGYAMFRPGYGKTNINERHNKDAFWDFSVEWLGSNVGALPAEAITLADLQADAGAEGYDANFPMFDASRLTGSEYYQGTLVRIQEVRFDGGDWGKDQTLTLTDGTYSLPCRLGISDDFLMPNLLDNEAGFDVIGIFDQESGNKDGYRIWVMGYDGGTDTLGIVPEPSTLLLLLPAAAAMPRRRRS